MKIGSKDVEPGTPVYVVCEIGINHDGSMEKAKFLIDCAKKAGADAVKFQKRDLNALYSSDVVAGASCDQSVETLIPVLRACEFSEEQLDELRQYSLSKGLDFFFTPFDIPSADVLDGKLPCYKVASCDCTNLPLLDHLIKKGKPLFISTGMTTPEQLSKVVAFLKEKNAQYMLLHCIAGYPPGTDNLNLTYLKELQKFSPAVGYSAHELEPEYCLAAAALGACLIEKHITYDQNAPGPGHRASLLPEEFAHTVQLIRLNLSLAEVIQRFPGVKSALGDGKRTLTREEELSRISLQKSIYAARNIPSGKTLEKDDLVVRGPGGGMNPVEYFSVLGRKVINSLVGGEGLREAHFVSMLTDFPRVFEHGWGFKLRLAEAEKFHNEKMALFEFHMSPNDVSVPFNPTKHFNQQLVVHAPELISRDLGFSGTDMQSYVDMCSSDKKIREASIAMMKRTIKKTKEMAPYFEGVPQIVIHVGGYAFTQNYSNGIKDEMFELGVESFKQLDKKDVVLLPENMPPFPTHANARCYQAFFSAPEDLARFCKATGLHGCFDLSHAQLYCNSFGGSLVDFAKTVLPFAQHLHIADSSGIDGEGLQIGDGMIDFKPVFELFRSKNFTWVAEITNGHKNNFEGFKEANRRLQKFKDLL